MTRLFKNIVSGTYLLYIGLLPHYMRLGHPTILVATPKQTHSYTYIITLCSPQAGNEQSNLSQYHIPTSHKLDINSIDAYIVI